MTNATGKKYYPSKSTMVITFRVTNEVYEILKRRANGDINKYARDFIEKEMKRNHHGRRS